MKFAKTKLFVLTSALCLTSLSFADSTLNTMQLSYEGAPFPVSDFGKYSQFDQMKLTVKDDNTGETAQYTIAPKNNPFLPGYSNATIGIPTKYTSIVSAQYSHTFLPASPDAFEVYSISSPIKIINQGNLSFQSCKNYYGSQGIPYPC